MNEVVAEIHTSERWYLTMAWHKKHINAYNFKWIIKQMFYISCVDGVDAEDLYCDILVNGKCVNRIYLKTRCDGSIVDSWLFIDNVFVRKMSIAS